MHNGRRKNGDGLGRFYLLITLIFVQTRSFCATPRVPLVMMPPKRYRRELSKSPTRGCPKSSWSGIQTASHEKPCLYKTGYLKGVFVQSRSSLLQRDLLGALDAPSMGKLRLRDQP